jgi:hypothetical protein
MTPAIALAILGAFLTVASAAVLRRWLHPVVMYFALWTVILLSLVPNLLHLRPLTARGAGLLALGLGAVFLGCLGGQELARRLRSNEDHNPTHPDSSTVRLTVFLLIATILFVYGVFIFRNSISAAAGGGSGFSSLEPQQVLYLSEHGNANSSLSGIFVSLAPVIACGGVILGRRIVWGYAFTILALVLITTDPARTLTYITAVAALITWLYTSRRGRRRYSVWRVTIAALAAIGGLLYFHHQEVVLNKTQHIATLDASPLPSSLVPTTLFFTGAPVALSQALDSHRDPAAGPSLRTIWIVPRVAQLVDSRVQVPNTVAQFVQIPYSYNVYTWVGDAYYDFGVAGIIGEGILLGAVSVVLDALARKRRTALWTSLGAVWVGVLFSSIFTFQVFWLGTATWILASLVIFSRQSPNLLSRSPGAPAAEQQQQPDTMRVTG